MHTKLHRETRAKAGNFCKRSKRVTETKNLYGRKFYIFWIWDNTSDSEITKSNPKLLSMSSGLEKSNPVDGGLEEWTPCTAPCDGGLQSVLRLCNNPAPTDNG